MNIHTNKSTLIKIISFCVATVILFGGGCLYFYNQAKNYQLVLENTYRRSLQDLNDYVDNISIYLQKGLYANSSYQLSEISSNLMSNSKGALSCLSSLPASELHLDNTFKFLSQVGAYSSYLARKSHSDNKISDAEHKSLQQLTDYSKKLNTYIASIDNNVLTNNLDLGNNKLFSPINLKNNKNSKNIADSAADDNLGFINIEEGFSGYPTLIYDGPFSDHILVKKPSLIKDKSEVSPQKAQKTISLAMGVNYNSLKRIGDENANIPLYCFSGDNLYAGITKNGGLVCYILKNRSISKPSIETGDAIENARRFLSETLGLKNMQHSYYQIENNMCIINFAATQDSVILYPDLIKVAVALDNGEIMSLDARGYINNHKDRQLKKPIKTSLEAQRSLSNYLTPIKEPSLAIIPSNGLNDVSVYEFVCRSKDNQTVLVYINTDTLQEEQILILMDSDDGVLTI